MPPQRKTRSWLTTMRQEAGDDLISTRQKPEPDVEKWVYRFLGNLAAIEDDKNKAKKRALRFQLRRGTRVSKPRRQRIRSPTPYSWDRLSPRSPVAMFQNPVDSDMTMDEDDEDDVKVPVPPDITPITASRYAMNAVLAESPRIIGPGEDRTLLQRINRYIRAGIAEGKRRAKRYVRKALSFALETGYLMPADRDGKLLRVSPKLADVITQPPKKRKGVPKVRRRRLTKKKAVKKSAGSKKKNETQDNTKTTRESTRNKNTTITTPPPELEKTMFVKTRQSNEDMRVTGAITRSKEKLMYKGDTRRGSSKVHTSRSRSRSRSRPKDNQEGKPTVPATGEEPDAQQQEQQQQQQQQQQAMSMSTRTRSSSASTKGRDARSLSNSRKGSL